jgi:hypothetical protein
LRVEASQVLCGRNRLQEGRAQGERWFDRRRGGRRPEDLITATGVASFVYCPEQWRLEYGVGLPAENLSALDHGTRDHARKALVERLASWSIRLGLVIAIVALGRLLMWANLR